jgi:hypothetical protein
MPLGNASELVLISVPKLYASIKDTWSAYINTSPILQSVELFLISLRRIINEGTVKGNYAPNGLQATEAWYF